MNDYSDRLKATEARGLKLFPELPDDDRTLIFQFMERLGTSGDFYADFMYTLAGFLVEYPSSAEQFQKALLILVEKAREKGLPMRAHTGPAQTDEHTIADFPEFEQELRDLQKAGLLQKGTKKVQ